MDARTLQCEMIVNKEDLINYLLTCQEDAWTKEGWDKLFDDLETVLSYYKEKKVY